MDSGGKSVISSSFIKYFTFYFLPAVIVALAVTIYIYFDDAANQKIIVKNHERVAVEETKSQIVHDFDMVVSDLLILAESHEVIRSLEGEEGEEEDLKLDLIGFSKKRGIYDQLRVIDLKGMEKVRVNYDSGIPRVVDKDKLQFKGNRYYVKDTLPLGPGEVFVSPFDLNIEHGQIELPRKPMVRFATPIFDREGIKKGILVINYLGRNLLSAFSHNKSRTYGTLMLINRDGYWLKGENSDQEWGFMFPDKKHVTLSAEYPHIWNEIKKQESGQFLSGNKLVTYTTVYPLLQTKRKSTPLVSSSQMLSMDDTKYAWIVMSLVDKDAVLSLTEAKFKQLLWFNGLILVVAAVGSILLSLAKQKRSEAEQALLESEQKFRTIGMSSMDALIMIDHKRRIHFWNPVATALFGYSSEEAHHRDICELVISDSIHNRCNDRLTDVLRSGKGWCVDHSTELEAKKRNGTTRPVEMGISPFLKGGNYWAIVTLHDLTKQKISENALKQARDAAQSALKEAQLSTKYKNDFLANVSHEIRTPMNGVIGMAHLCMQTELTTQQRDYIQKIHSSAMTLLRIINDILDISKIEAGKLDMENVQFYIDDVLDNTATFSSIKALDKGLELVFSTDPFVPKSLYGDPLRLGQILINLTNNAIKFTETGEIVVSTELVDERNDYVTLKFSVRDTGVGLSLHEKEKIFEAFSQADASTTRKYGGTGLGLAICKKLVSMMGGNIGVVSEPGKGSVFYFTVQFQRALDKRSNGLVTPLDLRGMKVLAVDDNPTSLRVLSEVLSSFSFDVSVATTGKEALELIRGAAATEPYKLLMLDWHLPDLDGTVVARTIADSHEIAVKPKIILVTAHGREEVMRQARTSRLSGFLIKPVSRSLLFNTILNTFGKRVGSGKPSIEPDSPYTSQIHGLLSGASILLVEDNEINQQIAIELLSGAGLNVECAENGQLALTRVQQKHYDCVLMDIQMPVMGGIEATREIRKLAAGKEESRFSKLPIIAMTANAMSGDRQRSLAAGMNDHVNKPIDPDELMATIERWILSFRESHGMRQPEPSPIGIYSEAGISQILHRFDVATALKRMGGNVSLYLKLLFKMQREYHNAPHQIRNALLSDQIEEAGRLAHTVKAVSGNLGAAELSASAKELETAIINTGGDVSALIDKLEHSILESLSEVRKLGIEENFEKPPDDGAPVDGETVLTILTELESALNTHKPSVYKPYADRVRNLIWPSELANTGARLGDLIENYDVTEAASLCTEVRLQLQNNGITSVEQEKGALQGEEGLQRERTFQAES